MGVRRIDLAAGLSPPPETVIVCVDVDQRSDKSDRCLRSVVAHTPSHVPIVICDRSGSEAVQDSISALADEAPSTRELAYLDLRGHGLLAVLDLSSPADVVLLSSDCETASGWLEGLRTAAHGDSRVASASAMSQDVADLGSAAAAVRAVSLRLRPRLPTVNPACVYVRRSALELAGLLEGCDTAEELWRRCTRSGLAHVLADDVLVRRPGGGCFPSEDDGIGPLSHSLSAARRALRGLSAVIDARILTGPVTGTKIHVLETVAALARTGEVDLTVVVPSDLSEYAARCLETLPEVTVVSHTDAPRLARIRADVVHRPFQINNAAELIFLSQLGDRLVITHQDLIGYFNASYFPSAEAWQRYRQLTKGVLAIADRVVFFSAHARDDALAEELVEPHRTSVVHIGVDHRGTAGHGRPTPPANTARLPDGAAVVLCIGADYRHKNRLFALRVAQELQRRHAWRGYLVFAGPKVAEGSSRGEEAQLLAGDRTLAHAVLDCSAVSEAEKAWLLQRARLVIYPTVHEGFGLVPFEAADHEVPCMWAAGTSLAELLPEADATISTWDAPETADHAAALLHDEQLRQRNIESIREAGSALTWAATAAGLLEVYRATCDAPATPGSVLERRHGRISAAVSEDAMRLVGPGGALPTDVERPLLALATHPQLGRPVLGALKLGYRTSYRLRRLAAGKQGTGSEGQRRR